MSSNDINKARTEDKSAMGPPTPMGAPKTTPDRMTIETDRLALVTFGRVAGKVVDVSITGLTKSKVGFKFVKDLMAAGITAEELNLSQEIQDFINTWC
jgi:hypothetical protein